MSKAEAAQAARDAALGSIVNEQLPALGGERDAVDAEDLSGLDRGDTLAPAPSPKPDKEADTKPAAAPAADDAPSAEETDSKVVDTPSEAAKEPGKEADKKADTKPAEEPKKGWIPKDRFDEVNERRKRAEAELQQLRQEKEAAAKGGEKSFDFEAAEKAYMEAILDGRTDDALAQRREIRAAEQAAVRALNQRETNEVVTSRKDEEAIASIVAKTEAEFPEFDPNNEELYREELIEEVAAHYEAQLNRGKPRPEAFALAVKNVVKLNDLVPAMEAPPAPAKPVAQQKKAAERKVELANKAPPVVADAGSGAADAGAAVLDIDQLSDKEYEALPESTRKRLRGDFV